MAKGEGGVSTYYGPQSAKTDWEEGQTTTQPNIEVASDPNWEYVGPGSEPGEGTYKYVGSPPSAPPVAAHQPAAAHHPPAHHHPGGGGGGTDPYLSMYEQLLNQYDQLLNQYLNPPGQQGREPGMGFEDTILSRRVLQDEELRGPGLFPTTPQRQVMDPITGAIYPNPAAALRAGVTSWQYVPIGQAPVGGQGGLPAAPGGPATPAPEPGSDTAPSGRPGRWGGFGSDMLTRYANRFGQ